MKNKKITRKITLGMYVLTTKNGGCIVDAVSQVSMGDNPLIAVSVMKKNYTNELLKMNDKFAISILSKDVDGKIIKTFGFVVPQCETDYEPFQKKMQKAEKELVREILS